MDDEGGNGVCPAYDVGVTSKAGDMITLSLADFICSDFDSTVDNHKYPMRNCPEEGCGHHVQGRPSAQVAGRLLRAALRQRHRGDDASSFSVHLAIAYLRLL